MSVSVACLRSHFFTLSVSVACLQTTCRQRLSADKAVCLRLTLFTCITCVAQERLVEGVNSDDTRWHFFCQGTLKSFFRVHFPGIKFWSEVSPEVGRIWPFSVILMMIWESAEADQAFGFMIEFWFWGTLAQKCHVVSWKIFRFVSGL